MTTSQQKEFLAEVASEDARIPEGKLAYFQERLRNNLYNFVLSRFAERQAEGFTQADLARRIDYDPARVSKLLGAPGNWTLDTVSDLLVGIASEELVPSSTSLLNREPRNYRQPEWITSTATSTNSSQNIIPFSDVRK